MIAWGFHYSEGGNKTGAGAFIQRLNAAGIPVTMKGTASAGLCFEAQDIGKQHGIDNLLIYRMTNNANFEYDTPRYDLPPSEAARLHWDATRIIWPQELDPALVWMEPINEPRAKLETDETTPTWGGMHPVAWLGRFMVEFASIANANGFKACGPSFSSGDPSVELWQLDGMADWLRYCAEHPTQAAVSIHEYNYGSVPFDDNYPWHYGRFQAIIAAADVLGIPRTFQIFATEFGWQYENVPTWETAVPTLQRYTELAARFPQLKGAALWTLQSGWGGISDQLAQWIAPDGNPFANWIINNQLETLQQPQPTAPEFGATLPGDTTQPPDGGGGEPVTTYKNLGDSSRPPTGATHMRVAWRKRVQKTSAVYELHWRGQSELIPINPDSDDIMLVWFQEENDEPVNPNPPPVVSNPLPQGALVVDVSYANDVNLATLKANGVQGVIIRASNGIRLTDSSNAVGVDVRFWQHLEEAAQLGMPWGSYHYCNENYDDVAQVQHFLSIVETAVNEGYPLPSLGLWLDFETPDNPLYAPAPASEDRIQALCTTLASLRPSTVADYGVYTSKGWWDAKVPNAASWVPSLGLKAWAAAWPDTSVLVNGWPLSWWHPANLKGFTAVHFWQWTSVGGFEVGHSVDSLDLNFVGNTAVVPGTPPTPPPPAENIDVAPYFTPAAQYGPKIVMQVGSGSQPMQLEKRPFDVILRKGDGNWIDGKKYQDSEQWRVKDGQIQKGKDTSDAGNGGRDGYDLGWVQWVPQFVAIGRTYHSTPTVNRFNRTNGCQVYSTAVANDYLHIKAILPTWTSPANSAIMLNDVLIIEWRSGTADLNQPPNETYYFAKGIGYVGWGTHFIAEITQGQAPLTGALDCGM